MHRALVLALILSFSTGFSFAQKKIGRAKNMIALPVGQNLYFSEDCGCPDGHLFINDAGDQICNPVDTLSFNKIYKKDYSFLVSGSDNSSLLSQIIVSIDKPSISLQQTFVGDERRVITPGYSIKGTLSDNISKLFTSSDGWSPGLSFGPRVNIDIVKLLNNFKGTASQWYFADVFESERNKCNAKKLQSDLVLRESKLIEQRDKFKNRLDSICVAYNSSSDQVEKDALESLRVKTRVQYDSTWIKLLPDSTKKYNQDQFYELNKKFKWNLKRYLWLSTGYIFAAKNYNLFDSTNIKEQFISKQNLLATTFSATLNFYQTSELPTKFLHNWNIYVGLTYSNEHTNDILNDDYNRKYEREVKKYTDKLGTYVFEATEKKVFYMGNHRRVTNHKIDAQTIVFVNKKKDYGIDLHTSLVVPDKNSLMSITNFTAGVGVILPVISSDGKSKLNINVVLDFLDIGGRIEDWKVKQDDGYQKKSVSERLNLSVKVGLPIYKL